MGVVRDLIAEVIASADAVCTTPYTSDEKVYELFKPTIARGVVLDEAGAMHQADAMQVWGPGCRPCVLAGDERQLPPAVMTDGQRNIALYRVVLMLRGRLFTQMSSVFSMRPRSRFRIIPRLARLRRGLLTDTIPV